MEAAMSTQTVSVPDVYPFLFYRDAKAAMDWLSRAFGFEARLVVPGPDGDVAHAEMTMGSTVIMLGSAKPEKGWVSPLDLPGAPVCGGICVYVADPDAHYARATAAGAKITDELKDTNYGARGYMARDLEGHSWSFATYRPGSHWSQDVDLTSKIAR
jgi:uncharacterized glyoxalase superfamily protein PhnB